MKNQTFELNGKSYRTTLECITLLRKYRNDNQLFGCVFEVARMAGTIEETN